VVDVDALGGACIATVEEGQGCLPGEDGAVVAEAFGYDIKECVAVGVE
jgi:hypothetical protein